VGEVDSARSLGRIRVTLDTGRVLSLKFAALVGDSIRGVSERKTMDTVAVPAGQVKRLQVRRTKVLATVALVVGIGFLAFGAVAAASFSMTPLTFSTIPWQ
jgi:hypothetical protein